MKELDVVTLKNDFNGVPAGTPLKSLFNVTTSNSFIKHSPFASLP